MLFNKKVCLALGGGGARGLCYLGILKVLEDNGFFPDIITGTSMGAMVGGAYAARQSSIQELIEVFEAILYSRKFKELGLTVIETINKHTYTGFFRKLKNTVAKINFYRKLESRDYIISNKKFESTLRMILPDEQIENLPVRFACVALNIQSKKAVVLSRGPLIRAVMASGAIPGIFQPVRWEDDLLIDGGWIELIPVPAGWQAGAHRIIAVDIRKEHPLLHAHSGLDLMNNAGKVVGDHLVDVQIKSADLILKVRSDFEWYDFHDYPKLIEAGVRIARENLPRIKKVFRRQKGLLRFS